MTKQSDLSWSRSSLLDFDGIITKARPGDQFVSIDGKRTYFDLGEVLF